MIFFFLFLRLINDKWFLSKRHFKLKKRAWYTIPICYKLSVMYKIFRVLEIYCLSRELHFGIVNHSSSLPVLSLFIYISVCESYGRWTFLKIFRNRESKVSHILIAASVFVSVSSVVQPVGLIFLYSKLFGACIMNYYHLSPVCHTLCNY